MTCRLNSFEAVLQQECEISYNFAVQSYTDSLKTYLANRKDPIEIPQLFETLKVIRDQAVDEFAISVEVREKYKNYDDYLAQLQTFINKQEDVIIQVNENLAEQFTKKEKPSPDLLARAKVRSANRPSADQFRPQGEVCRHYEAVLRRVCKERQGCAQSQYTQ